MLRWRPRCLLCPDKLMLVNPLGVFQVPFDRSLLFVLRAQKQKAFFGEKVMRVW